MKKYIGFEEPLLLHVVSKHALSELQPLIATRTALYRTGEKNHNNHKQDDVHPKLLSFLLSGKVQTASTRLRVPFEKSDKHLQVVKSGGRSHVCLGMNHTVTSRDGRNPPWLSVPG